MSEKNATIKLLNNNANLAPSAAGGNWFIRLFGCWHKEMSRPFTDQGQTYRSCLDCGARRQFNLRRWEMQGDFYYGMPARRSVAAA